MNNPVSAKEQKSLQFNRGNPDSPAPQHRDRDLKDGQNKISELESNEDLQGDKKKQKDARKKKIAQAAEREEQKKSGFRPDK